VALLFVIAISKQERWDIILIIRAMCVHFCCVNFCKIKSPLIKLCPRGAQTCALPLFCDRDLEINPVTLKLEGDLDILKMYLHTKNEAVSLRHSKLRA